MVAIRPGAVNAADRRQARRDRRRAALYCSFRPVPTGPGDPLVSFEKTATRLWKRLSPPERLAASTAFWRQPAQDVLGAAIGAIVRARHMRPQAARSMPEEAQARALAAILDPGESLASSLLIGLHLSERRALLATFLDAIGLPHEDGVLKEDDAGAPLDEEKARAAVRALAAAHPRAQVETYLNTLWLQDPERWGVLTRFEEWI
jgi:hypothetical protein